jgi:hypothetical protein
VESNFNNDTDDTASFSTRTSMNNQKNKTELTNKSNSAWGMMNPLGPCVISLGSVPKGGNDASWRQVFKVKTVAVGNGGRRREDRKHGSSDTFPLYTKDEPTCNNS